MTKYITPEQKEEFYKFGNSTIVVAIKVCIRTGARFGSEFAKLEKRHVVDHGDRMEWVFKAGEIKNNRKRVIRITDPEVIQIVRNHMRTDGPLFRNTSGTP